LGREKSHEGINKLVAVARLAEKSADDIQFKGLNPGAAGASKRGKHIKESSFPKSIVVQSLSQIANRRNHGCLTEG